MNRSASFPIRVAFTLVELLVVIAIIGMLIMIMLPAVNAARESTRRAHCMSKLANLGVAMNNYEMAFETFPAGVRNPDGPVLNRPQGLHQSWTIDLLPQLDEKNLYGRIDPDISVYEERNGEARAKSPGILKCPSSPELATGVSSYAAVHNDVESPIDADNNGVFFLNSKTTRDDISDGLQYTFFLGEKNPDSADLGWMSGTRATLRNTGTQIGQHVVPRREFRTSAPAEVADESTFAADDAKETDSPPSVPLPETPELSRAVQEAIANGTYVGGFGSSHPSGALFVFGDGSVRFIPESVSMTVYQRYGHRADGQLIREED